MEVPCGNLATLTSYKPLRLRIRHQDKFVLIAGAVLETFVSRLHLSIEGLLDALDTAFLLLEEHALLLRRAHVEMP